MSFEIIKGDLIKEAVEGRAKIIVHGCNCFHAMGSGIAGALAMRFPQIPDSDRLTQRGSHEKLTAYSTAYVNEQVLLKAGEPEQLKHPFTCINLYTQYKPGADFLPSLFPRALQRLNADFKGETLWFPMIGCGIGGGDWAEVMTQMVKNLPDVDVKVVVYA